MYPIKRALLSVSDKTGLVEFAKQLAKRQVEILSTGGTAKLLRQHGIDVVDVSSYTGFPELMGGRVKTLHPKIHGGLLGRRGLDDAVMAQHGIKPIDLVVVNLYPFEQTVAQADCSLADAIENIDIGGPSMLRAAAKNHAAVTVIVDHQDYDLVLADMAQHDGAVNDANRFQLAVKAFAHTGKYDGAIANYLGQRTSEPAQRFPQSFSFQFEKAQDLRYGENPHQAAAFYRDQTCGFPSLASAKQHQGKELSFNNIADADAALECVKQFSDPACVIVKHANPCGAAVATDILAAYNKAHQTDPTSAFGGIIAFNRELDKSTAVTIIERQFVEVIIAPSVSVDALAALAAKPNVRMLTCGSWSHDATVPGLDLKRVAGGLLIQDRDNGQIKETDLKIVSQRQPNAQEIGDLMFSWKVAKFVKSNAIVYAKDGATMGIGAGQMSRVDSARIAILKAADAKLSVHSSVMASDAFFPFRDGIDAAARAGVVAIIQPGGSMRDQEIITAANEHGMTMVFTGMRHFRH